MSDETWRRRESQPLPSSSRTLRAYALLVRRGGHSARRSRHAICRPGARNDRRLSVTFRGVRRRRRRASCSLGESVLLLRACALRRPRAQPPAGSGCVLIRRPCARSPLSGRLAPWRPPLSTLRSAGGAYAMVDTSRTINATIAGHAHRWRNNPRFRRSASTRPIRTAKAGGSGVAASRHRV